MNDKLRYVAHAEWMEKMIKQGHKPKQCPKGNVKDGCLIVNNNYAVNLMLKLKIREIMNQREKICEAFIAETGCLPSEIEQVEERTEQGIKWYLQKRR